MQAKASDERWMRRALQLARRAQGRTRPNPPVGAVLVARGRLVAEAYHAGSGKPHAEILALRKAGRRAQGATLYVTLEPCSTHGRTGPCVPAIARSGVARVVVSVADPNPKHDGRGIRMLRRAGIRVESGLCAGEGWSLIKPFAKWIVTRLPFVTLKLGMTLDGRIADRSGRSKWITCGESRRRVRKLRRSADAIVVGGRTARRDNPSLLPARGGGHPARVIVTATGALPANLRLLNDGARRATIIATTRLCSERTRRRHASKGCRVWKLPVSSGRVALKPLLARLGAEGFLHVLCEGGGELAGSLIRGRLVDEILFFIAPRVMGDGGSAPAAGRRGWTLKAAPQFRIAGCEGVGDDILVRAMPLKGEAVRCSRD